MDEWQWDTDPQQLPTESVPLKHGCGTSLSLQNQPLTLASPCADANSATFANALCQHHRPAASTTSADNSFRDEKDGPHTRVPDTQHHWRLGLGNSLLWGLSCALQGAGQYPWPLPTTAAAPPAPVVMNKNVPRHCQCSCGEWGWGHWQNHS